MIVSLSATFCVTAVAASPDAQLSATDIPSNWSHGRLMEAVLPEAVRPTQTPTAMSTAALAVTPRFVASKEPVEALFTALGSEIHKPFLLSRKIRQYKVSGDFDLSHPFEVLDRVASTLGLIWYYDGQVVYVYDGAEASSVMLSIEPAQVDDLVAFLKDSALYDKRFPIRYGSGTGVAYVSGPPKYVDIVQNAARMLHTHRIEVQAGDETRHVEIVRLRHAFVGNRDYQRRDAQYEVAGLAQVLAQAFGNGLVDVRVAGGPQAGADQAPPPGAGDLPPGPNLAMPPGVAQMPAMNPALPLGTVQASEPEINVLTSAGQTPLRVVAYASTNSLLLEGTDRQIAMARRLIAQLDVPRDQVELSLWVIDVQKQDLDELGAQLSANANLGGVELGFNPTALGQGATLSHLQTQHFIASVTALSQRNKARIVSRPILLAQDNSPAIFDNSRSFYVKVHGERTANLYKVTYGTMIDVVPHVVDANGRIEMELGIEDGNSSSAGEGSNLELPIVSSTRISTVARVQHAQSILVGGYTQDQTDERLRKIPLLGDIPVVGNLFRYRTNSASQSVRLFLIQPRLLADDNQFDVHRTAMPKDVTDAVDALRQQIENEHA